MKNIQRWACMLLLLVVVSGLAMPTALAEKNPNQNVNDWLKEPESTDETPTKEGTKAEDPTLSEEMEQPVVGITFWGYVKAIFAFLFVIGLLYTILRFVNKRNRQYEQNRLMRNLGGIALGQQKSIQLVHVGNTYYVIGVGEEITLLKELTDPEEIEALIAQYEATEPAEFTSFIEQTMSRLKGKSKPKKSTAKEPFNEVFAKRLKELQNDRQKKLKKLSEKERDSSE